tara:strand:- start:153 stop:506 length:354 start_codon:yes stop_codon:yes gene_type:complete
MTANQVYKLSGSTTPFAEWIGEQKTKYGEKFIENEEFMNMAGSNFVGDNVPRSKEEVIMSNADENIQYPRGAGVAGSVTIGGTTAQASAGVKNIRNLVFLVGGVVVAIWAYNRYVKK